MGVMLVYVGRWAMCVCVLLGFFLPFWAKELVSRCWPVLGSLGMRVKITGCECLACLGGKCQLAGKGGPSEHRTSRGRYV